LVVVTEVFFQTIAWETIIIPTQAKVGALGSRSSWMVGRTMFELLQSVMSQYTGDDFLELRAHDRQARSILVEDGRLENARSTHHSGVGVRVYHRGAWGFASTSVLEPAALLRCVEAARAAAKAVAARQPSSSLPSLLSRVAFDNRSYAYPHQALADQSLAEKLELVFATERSARSSSTQIKQASVRYAELVDEKWIMTTDGARVHVVDDKPELRVQVVASLDGQLQSCTEAEGRTGGMAELFRRRSATQMADKAARTAVDLLRAPFVDGGSAQVILAPDVVGLLVHEAIGHTVEADFVLAGSAAAGKLGKQVASELVTLCDSGASEYEPGAGGVVLVDDEGVAAQKVTIIDRGVLTSYLHNRDSAQRMGATPTGNARAFEFDNEPLIRMRNTYIEPGTTAVDDMIADMRDGYVLRGAKNGQADANAEFMFVVGEVYPVKNGKLGKLHRGTTITGDAFAVLSSVDRVGSDFAWDLGSGFCGKGQPAKVDAGGPHIRCQVTLAGRGSDGGES
jgi:TldD protein